MQHRLGKDHLTPRETEVLILRAAGAGIREIGRRLNIQATTVDRHLSRIAAKLGSRDRGFLCQYAGDYNLLGGDGVPDP